MVLVRHGETDANSKRVMQLPDTPLSAAGIRQAEQLAARLAQLGVARIFCSDLWRARMTAEPIVARTGAPIELTPLLQERNFGELRGTPYADLPCDPFAADYVPPGGESWEAFYERTQAAFAASVARLAFLDHAREGNLVVITHGLLCAALVQRHAQVGPGLTVPARFDNASITLLDAEPPHFARLINCSAHLNESAAHDGAPA